MSPIPDDTRSSPESDELSTRIGTAGERAEESTRRISAAIAGALEGFVEALDRYDLSNEAKRAARQAGDVTRAAAVEGREVARTPEMQQVGSALRTAGEKTGEAGQRAAESLRETTRDMRHSVTSAVEDVKHAAHRVTEDVKVRAEAVAETGRRARHAPGHVAHELREAYHAWKRALMTTIAMFALLTVFSAIALVVLTIALVVGLNAWIGDPAGTFVVAGAYVLVAISAWAIARGARAKAAHEREEHVENIREEGRHVVRPMKDAFSRGRGA